MAAPMTLPQFSLQGKTCVVTGAGKGMGQQFLTAFALSGARGAVVDLTIEAGEASIRKIKETVKAAHPTFEVELRAYACDVSLEPQVKTAWAAIIKDFGTVDVLVTAAGIVQNFPAEDYPYDQWQKMLDINLTGSFLFAQAAGKFWLDNNKKGNIILISSVSCRVCVRPQKQIVYNTGKGALIMMGKSLATEWGPKGIRTNMLCPGYVMTDLVHDARRNLGENQIKEWEADIPLGRMAQPEEMQGTIVWMASEASAFLNGSEIIIDGGYTCY